MSEEKTTLLIDKEGGIRRVGGDADLYQELMEMFFDQSNQQIEELNDAIEKKETQSIKHLAHSIKGAASNLGVLLVQESAHVLEKNGNENKMNEALQNFNKLKQDLIRVKEIWENQN